MRSLALLACFVSVGCVSAPAPLKWYADTHEVVFTNTQVAMQAPPTWKMKKRFSGAYQFYFPGGSLLLFADDERISYRRAARAVRELMLELEGKVAADTPPKTFGLDYDELTAEYALAGGANLVAFHRTFACPPLNCHVTLVQREDAVEEDQAQRLAAIPRDPRQVSRAGSRRHWINADPGLRLVGALLGVGAVIGEGALKALANSHTGRP